MAAYIPADRRTLPSAGALPRRRLLRGGAFVAGGVVLGLAGCSGAKNAGRNGSAATGAATGQATGVSGAPGAVVAATPLQVASPKPGGVIHSAVGSATKLDPVANQTPLAQVTSGFHYSRLFRFNAGPEPRLSLSREPLPDLVSGYEVTPDGLTYTMQLRPGVRFHPPLSRTLTAADVMASWQYFNTSSTNTNKPFAAVVDDLTTPDAGTLVFRLKQPYAPFLNKLAFGYLWIMSQEAATGAIDPEQVVAGTGPWIFEGLTPMAYTWTRNPDYFIPGVPYADGAQLLVIGDTATQESQFVAGKLEVFGPPPTDIEIIQKAVPQALFIEYPANGLGFFGFSPVQDSSNSFNDLRLRQATSVAIDRQKLIDALYNGHGVWENIVPPGLGKWFLDPRGKEQGDSAKWFKHDPKTAQQLIAAAGHASTEVTFLYPINGYGELFDAAAEAIGRMLVDAGFKLTVAKVDYLSVYLNNGRGIFFTGSPPNTIAFHLQTPFSEPDDYLTGMLTRDGNRNYDRLDDPDLAALVRKQAIELDTNKRLQLVYDVQRAHAEQMYYPPIIYVTSYSFVQPWVQNYYVADDVGYGAESWAYMSVNNR